MALQEQMTLSSLEVWLMATRPKTIILSVAPVLLAGLLVLDGTAPVHWLMLPAILISAASIQIATNLWNDATDASSGLDKASERLGPPRVTSLGLMDATTVRKAAVGFLLLAALSGLYLVYFGGLPILAIGAIGIVCAFGYSSGPYPISGSPLGEVFVILFFGIMSVMGSVFLLTGEWTSTSFWSGVYIGLPAASVLTVNNHRDRVGDKEGGRRTLAIQLGPRKTKRLYTAMMLISCIGMIHVFNLIHHGTVSLVSLVVTAILAAYALAMPIRKLFLAETPADLNQCLVATSQFQLVWVVAFSAIMLFA
ncbi:1,4-dihydroxy-2-naphthoate octaprenyltransferase [Cohaesibacter sp. CAU 1516]|uniref:1,4-dihydroxy-2-naphthoate octaprenyltransferase n=1 Tax=Cohaesibacter sp. CAU 1516 TaxID=2576038 RepID=UPI0010FD8993|nr:1,4-dihydroxy-2-naphthoate octaprenyltransferase [Cohaesibacter sp. CAU 1516]TLP44780.1 1,4-dihydroxy-2-naphthoate octaprenyltransferase [Cohaesibacter sp. CAU 1516]